MELKKDLLERVAAHVLQDAAFVFAMPLMEERPDLSTWKAVGVRLAFSGPFDGWCEMWVPFEMSKLLAANMLGMEDNAPDAQEMCFDALKETLNIFSGNLLTELAGADPVFNLGTPSVMQKPELLSEGPHYAEAWFDSDDMPILIRVALADQATDAA